MSSGSLDLITALQHIAHGHTNCGRPLGGSTAQGIARDALFESGLGWSAKDLRPATSALLRARIERCADALDGFAAALEHAGLTENAAFARKQAADLRADTT